MNGWDWAPDRGPARGVVLVVDDDAAVANATAMLLETAGFDAVVATDASQAILMAGEREIDLVLCAYLLGAAETGDHVIRTIRATARPDVPAILISGNAPRDMYAALESIGPCGLLSKPVDADELLSLVDRLLCPATAPVAQGA